MYVVPFGAYAFYFFGANVCLARLQVLAMSKNYLSPITYDVLQKQNE